MGLFDDKEQVLDVQLTQYGKKMLQLGKFLPKFYAFSDEDVIYDTNHGGYTENQNDSQTRILDESVRLLPQYLFYGIETEFKKDVNALDKGQVFLNEPQPEADRTYSSISTLGNSQLNNSYRPAWRMTLASGEISSSYPAITGSISDLRIPQINLKDVIYDVNFIKNLPSDISDQLEAQNFESTVLDNEIEELSDGSIIEVVNKDIFINLEELNSLFNNDNFEIEMFIVEDKQIPGSPANCPRETLIPLHFKQKTFKRDDIYDDEEFFNSFGEGELNPSMVEYYFNVQADHEIPEDVRCKYIPQDRRKGVYGKYLNCPDTQIIIRREDYRSDVEPGEEPCDD